MRNGFFHSMSVNEKPCRDGEAVRDPGRIGAGDHAFTVAKIVPSASRRSAAPVNVRLPGKANVDKRGLMSAYDCRLNRSMQHRR